MAKVKFNGEATVQQGEKEWHYGFEFTAEKDKALIGEIPDEMVDNEVKAGRVTLLRPKKESEPKG